MSNEIVPVPRELIALENACKSLAEIHDVDTIKNMRDTAQRMVHWAKRRDYETSIINMAAEAKVRTERRLGEVLKEMPKHPGGQPAKNRSPDVTGSLPPSFAESGIKKNDSMKWQRIASIPEESFEQKIAEVKQSGKVLSTSTMIGLHRELNKPVKSHADQFDFSREGDEIERWLTARRDKWPAEHRPTFASFVAGILEEVGGSDAA